MRIDVNGGHTKTAPGSSKYLDELTEDRKVKDALKKELKARGHTVTDSTSPSSYDANGDLAYQAAKVNSSGCELGVSIHFNAASTTSGKRGTEVFYYGGDAAGKKYAAKISSMLASALGLPNRGAKDGSHLYYIRCTNPTTVLVEVCFVDAKGDASAYKKLGAAGVAEAIADAIELGAGKAASSSGWRKNGKGWWYREADGSYPKDAWRKVGGKWYRFDSAGYMVTGWCEVDGKWYHLSSSGAMDTGWYKGGNLWYFLDSSGAMQTGWHKSVKGEWYWLDEETGAMAVGWKSIGGKWYLFDDEGAMHSSECVERGGKWYAFATSGAMVEGSIALSDSGAMELG